MDASLRAQTGAKVAADLAADPAQQRRLAAYARQKFGIDAPTSEDLVQETIVELLRSNSAIQQTGGFVFRIFHLRCCAYAERDQRTRRFHLEAPPPERRETRVEDRVLLQEGFSRISTTCQHLLRAYYLEGKSLKETATECSLASSGVWKLINRCLRRLKACLS